MLSVIALSSCGGGGSGSPPPPPPTSTITSVTVSPSGTDLFIKATQQFTANVQGTGSFNSAVTWYVNDAQGGNATVGTISAGGLYTAPSAVPNPASLRERDIVCIHPSDFLGMVKGRESFAWSPRPATFLAPLRVHSLAPI
jgi:Bacterial Ig-like domain (group 2)